MASTYWQSGHGGWARLFVCVFNNAFVQTGRCFVRPHSAGKNRYSAPHFYGVRTARIRSNHLATSILFAQSKQRASPKPLSQKLSLVGCTMIVWRGGAGLLGCALEIGCTGTVTRYLL